MGLDTSLLLFLLLYHFLKVSVLSDLKCNFFQVTSVELEEVLSQGAYMLLYSRFVPEEFRFDLIFIFFSQVLFAV